MICRVCGAGRIDLMATLNDVPRSNHRLLRPEEVSGDHSMNMEIFRCGHCDFVFCEYLLDDSFYESDYLNAPSFSAQMAAFQRQQATDFVRHFDLAGKTIIDVGCGDGSYLDDLKTLGVNAVGLEPSQAQAALARERGFDVATGLVGADRIMDGAPFDGFVTREVLEHVPDIKGFLVGIRSNLKIGARGLVEVPNLEKLLKEQRFYDFIPEHVNYFTRRSLRLALELAGFDVVQVFTGMSDEYLIAYVGLRGQDSHRLSELQTQLDRLGRKLGAYIDGCRRANKRIGIWGAGGKGLNLLAAARVHDVEVLVDGDPHKEGLITPVTHLRVEAPRRLLERKVDVVIVTAPAYRNEIVKELRTELGFVGEIVVITEDLEAVQ
jgi:SAM-dependent methyltransferase